MAELGVREVTLIGGEAYLRDDWLRSCAPSARRHALHDDHGRARHRPPSARAPRPRRACRAPASRSTATRRRTIACAACRAPTASALAAAGHLRAAGHRSLGQHADQPAVDARAPRRARDDHRRSAPTPGRSSSRWPWAAPPTSPTCCSSPTICSSCFRCWRAERRAATRPACALWPGNNIGYFGPYESVLRGGLPRGHMASCGAGCSTLGIEADGAIKGCPSLHTRPWTGGNIRDASLQDIWERSAPLRYMRDRTVDDLWGYCRTCYYADACRAGCTWTGFSLFGKPGNNPALSPPRAGDATAGEARAPGAGRSAARAPRSITASSKSSSRRSRHEPSRPLPRLQPSRRRRRERLPVLRDRAARRVPGAAAAGAAPGALGRAALMAAGATLLGAAACSSEPLRAPTRQPTARPSPRTPARTAVWSRFVALRRRAAAGRAPLVGRTAPAAPAGRRRETLARTARSSRSTAPPFRPMVSASPKGADPPGVNVADRRQAVSSSRATATDRSGSTASAFHERPPP